MDLPDGQSRLRLPFRDIAESPFAVESINNENYRN